MGNFEAFLWNLNLSTNCLFWRCDLIDIINTATYCEFMRITVFHFDEKNKCEDVSSIKLIFQEVPLCILVLQSTY